MTTLEIADTTGAVLNQAVDADVAGDTARLTFGSRSGTDRNRDYAVALARVLEVFAAHGARLAAATVDSPALIEDRPQPADRNIQTSHRKPIELAAVDLDALRKELTNQREPGGDDGTPNPMSAGAWKRATFTFEFPSPTDCSRAQSELRGSSDPTAGAAPAGDDFEGAAEGALQTVLASRYERSQANRRACLAHHGDACKVCDKRMADVYGDIADGVIHVHHVVPLSELGGAYTVDPVRDLVPVCPNCHTMLHHGRAGAPRSAAELRAQLSRGG